MCSQAGKIQCVSIIMPTYNRADTLPRAIQSVLDQSWLHFELIIIDDGSDDGTEQVVRSFEDNRVHYIQSDHRGASAARNVGIAQAKYDAIAFLDSDDQWHKDFLTILTNCLTGATPETGVVFCGYWYFSESQKTYRPAECAFVAGDIMEEVIKGNFIALPAALVKKICFDQCGGFDESLPCRHDWELWIRIARQWQFQYVDKPLLNVYQSQSSISTNYKYLVEGWAPLIKKHLDLFSKYPEILASHYLKIARSVWPPADLEDYKTVRHYTLKAFWTSPKTMKDHLNQLAASIIGYCLYSFYRQMKHKLKAKRLNRH